MVTSTPVPDDDTSVARMQLIVQDRILSTVDPEILHRMILAARAARLMPEALENTVQWGVEYKGDYFPLQYELQAVNFRDARPDDTFLVNRDRTAYTDYVGPWIHVPQDPTGASS